MITDDAATIDGDAGDELLTATAEYHTGPLADDIADDSDLGLLAAPLTPPEGRWTTENPKPKLPAPPKTTLTRYALHTERTFALALCGFYDKSTLYALRWDNANMSHPVDGQRNGKRPGPSAEARLALSYVRLTDEGIFYCICTMTPHQGSSRFQADFDQHGDIRTSRIQLDPPMIIWANGLPWFPVYKAFYVLCGIYQLKDKKDLAYCRLQDLEGFTERVCASDPEADFDGDTFTYGRPFPNQDLPAQDEAKLRLISWKLMYGILDSFGNIAARRRKRARREKERENAATSDMHIPSWGRVAIAKPRSVAPR
ncbi:hypothetical protein N7536_004605 [Penicillium majusculum]|nr:hypothetical protein N7536_004605 [Penicillium majusculum]